MKLIYVAHPYGGKWHNKRKVERIIRQLIQQYPDYTFYSPIHALGFMYHDIDYDKGMEHCLEILKRCDELWLCEGWQSSKGCCMERQFAWRNSIKTSELLKRADGAYRTVRLPNMVAESEGEQ